VPQALTRVDPKLVFFDSWHGSYADSPRAISEELHRRQAGYEHIWTITPGNEGPDWATCVTPDDRRYVSYLGRAGYVVSNAGMPGYYRKRAAARYLQTWHGTPLKRIAFDIPSQSVANEPKYLRNFSRDVARWDALISPNAFSTDVFRRAFRFAGPMLETGYPRNDLLVSPEREEIRSRVREKLGIADADRVVLYAPTWRDSRDFDLELDVEAFLGELDDHFLLLRLHQLVAASVTATHPRMRDVSAYADNRELYLAADVLITDYSSVMFDFAVTRKPILFFTYDLENYRDQLRGFYFDFAQDAPGPLLSDTADLIEALGALDGVVARHAGAYDRFFERFCSLEDGGASARVIDAFFA
jgi:CDP-glycerol glycerophosphotransferase